MNVIHVCATPKPISESTSKQLAASFFTKLAELNPDVNVSNVDLYQNPPPFLSYDAYRYMWYPLFQENYKPTEAEKNAMTYSKAQATLVRDADFLVITMPMWNFTVPAIVKAWIDQVIAPNEIFTISPEGPRPLHHLRKVILLVSSGGVYKEDDVRDALTPHIRAAFGFIGITDIAVVWADGQNKLFYGDGEERKKMAVEAAQELAEEIAELKEGE